MLFTYLLFFPIFVRTTYSIAVNSLNMVVDPDLASNKQYLWHSVCQFDETIQDWSDGEIAGLAVQALRDAVNNGLSLKNADKQKWKSMRPPAAMTGIVLGNDLYLSSPFSAGGASFLYAPNNGPKKHRLDDEPKYSAAAENCPLVKNALVACTLSSGHWRSANCGEEMAAYEFCRLNENGSLSGAKVVTVSRHKDPVTGEEREFVLNPCVVRPDVLVEWPQAFGCNDLIPKLGMIPILEDTIPVARDPSGTPNCIIPQMC